MDATQENANPIVDHMLTSADFALKFDTKGMKQHETRVLGFTREQLGNGIGVNADSSLFNLQRVDLHGTSAPLGHSFGFVLGHSDSLEAPDAILTGAKAVFTDQTTGAAHLFHALTVPGKDKMESVHVHPTEAAKLQGTQTALRRAARWRENVTTDKLLGPESVLHGVTESSLDLGNGKKSVKYLVTPYSTDGEMKPSAMHRLLAQNGNNKQFFGGRYHPANRKTVPHLGQEAIVMTEADFNGIKAPLTDSLELKSKHPFENGLYIHMTKLDDLEAPKHVTLGGTFVREPLATTASSFARLNDLVQEDAQTSTASTQNTSTADILKAIHPECKGVTEEQSTMTALDTTMAELEVTDEN